MTQNSHPLIMVRTKAQSEATHSAVCAKLGWAVRVVYNPLIEIKPVNVALPNDMARPFVFTSQNAVEIATNTTDQRGVAICVGATVSASATQAGFDVQQVFDTAEYMIASGLPNDFTYLRGRQVSRDLDIYGGQSFVLYEQEPVTLRPETLAIMATGGVIPIYSQNAAMRLRDALDGKRTNATVICISKKVANRLDSAQFRSIDVANSPTSGEMVGSIAEALKLA